MGEHMIPATAPLGLTSYLGQYRGNDGCHYSITVWANSWDEAERTLAEQHPEGVIIGTLMGTIDAEDR